MKYLGRSLVLTLLLLSICCVGHQFYEHPNFDNHAENIQVNFSPRGETLNTIVNCINNAEHKILVAAYAFTSQPIADGLLKAHMRGVSVMVVADSRASKDRRSILPLLIKNGVPVRVNGKYAILHHKFIVIDDRHVQTGSFNYTAAAANKNAENVIVLFNMPQLANQYSSEWQKLWDEGQILK